MAAALLRGRADAVGAWCGCGRQARLRAETPGRLHGSAGGDGGDEEVILGDGVKEGMMKGICWRSFFSFSSPK